MTISMDPVIFNVGSHPVGWHGVMMAIGIVVAVWLTGHLAAKEGITKEAVYTAAFWIVLFGLIGARLTHVIDEWDFYNDNLSQIPAIWEGGMGWYGGLLGGIVGGVVYTRLYKIPLGIFADSVAIGGFVGLAIGRIGCTINGDAYGTPTSLPWGITYTHIDSYADLYVKGHPAPVYEIIWILVSVALLWKIKGRLRPPGSSFLIMLAMYSFGRFLISWVREEPAVLGPLHQAHLISLLLFITAVVLIVYRKVRFVKREQLDEAKGCDV